MYCQKWLELKKQGWRSITDHQISFHFVENESMGEMGQINHALNKSNHTKVMFHPLHFVPFTPNACVGAHLTIYF